MFEFKTSVPQGVFTPQDASEVLLLNYLDIQRSINLPHVQDLSDIIKKGHNRNAEICIAYLKADPENTKTLINGQHFCHAVKDANKNVKVNITYCECVDEEDIRDAYATFDSDERKRNLNELILVQSKNLNFARTKITNTIILMTVKAEIENRGMQKKRKSVRAEVTKDCLTHILFINGMFPRTVPCDNKDMLFHTAIFEIILRTWAANKREAEKFWKKVRDGVGLENLEPALILRNFLYPLYWKQGKITYKDKEISKGTLHKKLIFAWNSHRKGKKIKELYGNESSPVPTILP